TLRLPLGRRPLQVAAVRSTSGLAAPTIRRATMRYHLSTQLLAVALVAVAPALPAQSAHSASPAVRASAPVGAVAAEPDLATVRRATERFKNVNVALAEGYVRDPMNLCDDAEMMGKP